MYVLSMQEYVFESGTYLKSGSDPNSSSLAIPRAHTGQSWNGTLKSKDENPSRQSAKTKPR